MVDIYKGSSTKEYLEYYAEAPQEILVETVGPCNLRCIGCPQTLKEYQAEKWNPAFMDANLFVQILGEAARIWKPINVGLYHTGEVTLLPHDKFDWTLKTAKTIMPDSAGWDSVGFYTNGLLLDAKRRESVMEAGINWVRLSFDGGTKEAYESVRIGSNYEKVLENARALSALAKERGRQMRLEVIFVPYRENEQSIREFHHLWQDSGWKATTGGTMNYGGLMQEAVQDRRHIHQHKIRERHATPCPRVFEQFTVLVDGRVSLCSADPMGKFTLGDLTKQTIQEVWQGGLRMHALKTHKDKQAMNMTPCDVCDYTEFCATPNGEYFGGRQ